MKIGAIWAQAHDGALGKNGQIPWHLPEDLALFRRATMSYPVIMGRHTWQSLPDRFRPLPGRTNIVLSTDTEFVASGGIVARNITDALTHAHQHTDTYCWVIGGGHIYRSMLEHCDFAVVTHIDLMIPEADSYAPHIPLAGKNVAGKNTSQKLD